MDANVAWHNAGGLIACGRCFTQRFLPYPVLILSRAAGELPG
jgi:hypothetical protein